MSRRSRRTRRLPRSTWPALPLLVGMLLAEPVLAPSDAQQVAGAPFLEEAARLDGAGSFGCSGLALAASGDTLVAGGNEEVRVYERIGPASWTLTAVLDPLSADALTAFGGAVAVDGDTLAVGAPLEDGALVEGGAVHVFERGAPGAGAWGRTVRIELPGAAERDRFGASVALAGDVLFVGVPGADDTGGDTGAVHVYARDEGGPDNWGETQVLYSPDGSAARDFGRVCAAGAGRLAVTGLAALPALEGRVVLYEPSGTSWVESALLAAPSASPAFGRSLALEGERAAVGEPFDALDPARPGLVRVFERSPGGSWSETSSVSAPDASAGDGFGGSVALSRDALAVGSAQWTDDPGSASIVGAADLFLLPGVWRHAFRTTGGTNPLGNGGGVWLGWSVCLQGDALCVGAPGQDTSFQGAGRVLAYAPRTFRRRDR